MADKSVKLKLTLSDGRIIESNAFTLPQGPVGPAGPATLPNYVSFEKPTSISVNASGGERTVTGVAEWEADGSMESGEYHQVLLMPVEMLITAPVTDPPVVGGTINLGSPYFNRQPLINEYFLLRALSPTKNILTLAIARCKEKSGANAVCEIVNKNDISISPKKYLHNISGNNTGAFAMSLQVITNSSAPITTVEHLKSLGIFANQNNVPASGCALQGTDFRPAYCLRYVSGNLYFIAFNGVESPYQLNDSQVLKDFVVEI